MKKGLKSCLSVVLAVVGLFIVGVAVMFFANLCPPQGPWPMPPWCEGGMELPGMSQNDSGSDLPCPPPGPWPHPPGCESVKAEDFVYVQEGHAADFLKGPTLWISLGHDPFTWLDEIDALSPDAVAWVSIVPSDDALHEIAAQQALYTYQQESVLPLAVRMAPEYPDTAVAVDIPELDVLNLNLEPVSFPQLQQGGVELTPGAHWRNIMHPEYREQMLDSARYAIDNSGNGVVMDGWPAWVIYLRSGSFDKYSMDGFRGYLDQKYDQAELRAKFGIQDISSFNFRDYILENHLEETWNKSREAPDLNPLTYEFDLFLSGETNAFYRQFSETMKVYAHEHGGRDFLFSINASPVYDWMTLHQVDYLDYLTGEQLWFSRVFNKASVAVALTNDLLPSNKLVLLTEISHDQGRLPDQSSNLFKYAFADTYSASGGSLIIKGDAYFTLENGEYLPGENSVKIDQQEAGSYIRFMQAHRDLFDLDNQAKVAVVHSIASRQGYMMPIPDVSRDGNGITGVLELLYNLNVPFQTVVLGNDFAYMQTITPEDLAGYQVLILPVVHMISDEEAQVIYEYARNGGTVIQLREFGTRDKQGNLTPRPYLDGISDVDGEHSVGAGIWRTVLNSNALGYFWVSDENRSHLTYEYTSDDPAFLEMKDILFGYYSPEIVTGAAPTVNIRRYVDGNRLVLHLVNYDYDQTSDQFTPAGPFEVSVATDGKELTKAKLYDFEAETVTEIPLEQAEGMVKFTVPDLFAYSIVELLP